MQPFSLLLGLGALAGLLLAGWRAPKKETVHYVDAAVFAMFISLVGSRVMSVAMNWGYYAAHLGEIFQVWLGGLSGIGALASGGLSVIIIARWWRLPLGVLADTLLPLVGALTITAWLGCWVGTCAYGLPSSAWWAVPVRDEWGMLARRVPVQLVGATSTLVLIWLMDWAGKRVVLPGLSAGVGLFSISAIIFSLSYWRVDPMPIWHGLRLEAWGAIGLMILSALIVVVLLVGWKLKKLPVPERRVP